MRESIVWIICQALSECFYNLEGNKLLSNLVEQLPVPSRAFIELSRTMDESGQLKHRRHIIIRSVYATPLLQKEGR